MRQAKKLSWLSELAGPRSIGKGADPVSISSCFLFAVPVSIGETIEVLVPKKREYKIFWEAHIATSNCIEHLRAELS